TRPYSNDLRERAMARVAAGETIRVVAAALRISPSCVSKWSGRHCHVAIVTSPLGLPSVTFSRKHR
ncbi:MAG: helix-turn-helix domain-containing protein, partial [Methylocella sp.]